MKTLERLLNDRVTIQLKSEVERYLEGALEGGEYLIHTDTECFNNITVKVIGSDEKTLAYMSGYYIQFHDYKDLIFNADGHDENFYNIVSNVEDYVSKIKEPQSIYFNLFINANMSCEVEAQLYIHLKDMIYTVLHYVPEYVAGYIRKETWNMVGRELTKQGFKVINEDIDCLEILCKGNEECRNVTLWG